MTDIISTKDGRLHIYVRQDKYKGKLKSENWVGRTFHNGKQKVISSGTTELEEAKIILEKWYDDLISGKLEENLDNKDNTTINPLENDSSNHELEGNEKEKNEKIIKEEKEASAPIVAEEKKKKLFNLDLSSLKNLSSLKDKFSFKRKETNKEGKEKKKNLSNLKKLFSEKISKANVAGEEIAGIDISEESIKIAQLSKTDSNWILEKISLRLLDKNKTADGIINSKDYVSEELKLAIENSKIVTTNVAISIPVTSAIIRVVTSPLMSDEELQKAIETDSLWENLVQLTDDLNEYSIFHQVISRNNKTNTMEILFVASKLSDVNSYSSIIKKAGLNPVIMDVKCFTLKNAFDNALKIENKANNALLEIGSEDNYLIIVHDNIPIITDIFLRPNEKELFTQHAENMQNEDLDNVVRRYCMQIKQALSDYESKYTSKINNIKIVSSLNNIEELIPLFRKNLLNTGLQVFDPLNEIKVPEYNKEKTDIKNKSIYTSVLGLAYRKLDVFGYYKFVTAVKNINLLPNREALKRQTKMKFLSGFAMKGLVGGIAALYIFLIGFSFFQISSNKNKLVNEINIQQEFDLISIEQQKLTKISGDMDKALKLGSMIASNQTISYRALAQITRSVPQRVQFTNLNYNGSNEIIITGLAFSDQDIINFISNLNGKDLIDQASLKAMNVPTGQNDLQSANNKKGFTILCKLKT
ncbi:pilus assembly protein PilM [Pelagibacterales bacterium SAG-MED39]|nr:pilus assembly protein PilM [Pelagibacterales bacterium SAG-MED39]